MRKLKLFSLLGFVIMFAMTMPMVSCGSDDDDITSEATYSDDDSDDSSGSGSSSGGSSSSSDSSDSDSWEITTHTGSLLWYCPTTEKETSRTRVSVSIRRNRSTGEYLVRWAGKDYSTSAGTFELELDYKYHTVKVGKKSVTCRDQQILRVKVY